MAYKFTYFQSKAIGEPIRLLLSYGNLEFEDVRVNFEDEWPKVKKTMPMEQLPILEFDGKRIHQSISICRFLAKKVGLDGKTDLENFEIDSVVDTINDIRYKIAVMHYEQDQTLQETKRKTLNAETIPFYLGKLEEIAKENKGHLALKRLTWADLYFTGVIDYINYMTKQDLTASHPNLKKVIDTTSQVDSIKKWIEKRPKSDW